MIAPPQSRDSLQKPVLIFASRGQFYSVGRCDIKKLTPKMISAHKVLLGNGRIKYSRSLRATNRQLALYFRMYFQKHARLDSSGFLYNTRAGSYRATIEPIFRSQCPCAIIDSLSYQQKPNNRSASNNRTLGNFGSETQTVPFYCRSFSVLVGKINCVLFVNYQSMDAYRMRQKHIGCTRARIITVTYSSSQRDVINIRDYLSFWLLAPKFQSYPFL